MTLTCTGCEKPLESNCNERYIQVRHPFMGGSGFVFGISPELPSIPSGDWRESCLLAELAVQ